MAALNDRGWSVRYAQSAFRLMKSSFHGSRNSYLFGVLAWIKCGICSQWFNNYYRGATSPITSPVIFSFLSPLSLLGSLGSACNLWTGWLSLLLQYRFVVVEGPLTPLFYPLRFCDLVVIWRTPHGWQMIFKGAIVISAPRMILTFFTHD